MANRNRTGRPGADHRTGWVWVVVGIVAVALIVWWVAAAVDGGEDEVTQDEMTAVEQTEATGDEFADEQIFENGDGVFLEEEDQAPGSGQVLGGTPEAGQQLQTDESDAVEQYTNWSDRTQDTQVDEEYAADGLEQLHAAVGSLLNNYVEAPAAGEQAGGGPTRGQSEELAEHQRAFEESLQRMQQAQQGDQSQLFHETANTAAQTLQLIQREAGLDDLDQPVEQLFAHVHQIRPDQPLSEQGEQVQSFFDQSSRVVSQMSQDLQGSQAGEPQPGEQGAPQ